MKTIYSLREFHEKVSKISNVEPSLVSVQVHYGIHDKWEFSCYFHGAGVYFSGKTMEESLQKLQEYINPPTQVIDVEIEVEQETETI
jgi:hypothetical protein